VGSRMHSRSALKACRALLNVAKSLPQLYAYSTMQCRLTFVLNSEYGEVAA
jgi:hypothetical protein